MVFISSTGHSYIILTQLMVTTWLFSWLRYLSITFAALSFYILEPTLAGQPVIMGTKMVVVSYRPIFCKWFRWLWLYSLFGDSTKGQTFGEGWLSMLWIKQTLRCKTTQVRLIDQGDWYNGGRDYHDWWLRCPTLKANSTQQILPGVELNTVVSRSLSTEA